MKNLKTFVNESLNTNIDDEFDIIFDEFLNEIEDDNDKNIVVGLKESWKQKTSGYFAKHAGNAAGHVKSFLHSMWNDEHVGRH